MYDHLRIERIERKIPDWLGEPSPRQPSPAPVETRQSAPTRRIVSDDGNSLAGLDFEVIFADHKTKAMASRYHGKE
jgi:hypothetical protein